MVIIYLDDLQAQKPMQDELRVILNDTDSDADDDNLLGSSLASRNRHAKAVDVAGMRIAGRGVVFRGRVRSPPSDPAIALPGDLVRFVGRGNLWRNGLMRKHRSTIFAVDDVSLMTRRADVLIPHEATSVHRHGWGAVDALASSLRVRQSLHGHHHACLHF